MKSNRLRELFAQVRRGVLFLAGGVLFVSSVQGHQGVPPTTVEKSISPLKSIAQYTLPATDVAKELAKDLGAPPPLRFAVANAVQVTPQTHGTWEAVSGGRIWRFRVSSEGATDLNFGFTSYWMPEGAMLWIISEADSFYEGPYTSEHNQDYRQLWTPIVPGSAATLELFVPDNVQKEPELALTQVNTGYRDLFHLKEGGLAKAGSCEIDVTCPQAAPWANEIRSVCRILIGGTALCTATLIMDAPGDFRAFLLTANHCGITSVNAPTVVAYWNFQAPCGSHGIGGSTAQNQTGSTFRAAKADVDFCLIELSSLPNAAFNVYYAGWDRSGAVPGNGVGIHHPNGDGKCISFANGAFSTISSCIGSGGVNTHWQVPWQNPPQGVTEPGSSGSAIFDSSSHLVLGTLSGGPSSCSATPANLWDCYGKFAVSWASGSSSADRLRDWLDPSNTGITTKPGANPPSLAPANDACSGAITMNMGQTYSADTTAATSTGDPVPTCRSTFGNGVWYSFTAPATATYTVSTCGSSFDTVVSVYSGVCGSLTPIACNDDNGPDCATVQASVAFSGSSGTTYYILAGGYNNQTGTLNIKIDLMNDVCANAIPLQAGIPVDLDTTTATSTGEPTPSCSFNSLFGKGVWFTFTPSANEQVLVSACGSSFDTVVGVYTGSCGALTQIACDDDNGPDCSALQSSVLFTGTAGTTYYILAGGYNSAAGHLHLVASLGANDKCAGAIPLADGLPYTENTLDASGTSDPSACGFLGKGVWFTYTPPSSGIVAVDACGSSFDTVIAGYSGTCGSLTQVGCNDDGLQNCGSLISDLQFAGTGGTTYYLLAGGFAGSSGNLTITPHVLPATTLNVASFPNNLFVNMLQNDASGNYGGTTPYARTYGAGTVIHLYAPSTDGFNVFLKWQLDGVDLTTATEAVFTNDVNHTATAIYVPPNDQCVNAVALTTGVPYTMSTAGATSTGDPSGCGGLGNGVWFTYTPSASGVVTLNACGSDYDTVVQAFSGTCGSLAVLQCNDDGNQCSANYVASFSQFMGTAGTTYYILAGGFGGATGNLSLTANVAPSTTLAVTSFPNSIFTGGTPDDVSGLFGGNTPYNRVYARNTIVGVFAPSNDGFNVFSKWQLDGADYTTNSAANFTNDVNHTATAIYVPLNDRCAGAIALTNGVAFDENTTNATSTGDAAANCGSLGNGVWFTYTPSASGVVIIDTCGSSYDTAVQAYTGTCGSLTAVTGGGCNDDSGTCAGNIYAAYAEFMGTAGTTYYIQAGGFVGARGMLHIVASVVAPETLTVNSIPGGMGIAAGPVDTGGSFGGSAPFSRTYGAGTVVSLFAPSIAGVNAFSKWQLDGADLTTSQSASVTMNGNHTATAIYVPTNDLCVGAIALTNGVPFSMSTAGATSAGDPFPACSFAGLFGKGVWFTYTPTADEEVMLQTCNSDFDTILQVFTGACGSLQRVPYGCDDDSGPAGCATSTRASIVFRGQAAVTYYILAGGYNNAVGNLQIVATSALVNDDCSGALPLAYGVPFRMNTASANTGASESPACRPQPAFGKGVWFYFYSPVTGQVPISTCGSSFDTVIEVYTGSCGALTSVACDDDFGPSCPSSRSASVSINAIQGTIYYVLAGGFNSASGELEITVGTPPTLTLSQSGGLVSASWPLYYWPGYVLQAQSAGSGGIGTGPWLDVLPNFAPTRSFGTSNAASFFQLVTP